MMDEIDKKIVKKNTLPCRGERAPIPEGGPPNDLSGVPDLRILEPG